MQPRSNKMIVLKKIKLSESDLIVHGLTVTGARLHLVARGALRSKKRFGGGVLEPSHFIEIEYTPPSESSQMGVLLEAKILDSFEGLRKDYDRLDTALRLLEVVEKSSPGGEIPGSFDLLGNALKSLDLGHRQDRVELQFLVKLLWIHGLLEKQDWMLEFLRLPIRTEADEKLRASTDGTRMNWARHQVKQFLEGNL